MNKSNKYHGYTKQQYLICLARNIIFQVPEEQDHLLLDFDKEITSAIVEYLRTTTKENLEMIWLNKFEFKMHFDDVKNVFRMKFEYLH